MKRIFKIVMIVGVIFLICNISGCFFNRVASTFKSDAEGWTVSGDAQGGKVEPNFKDSGGNPGGYISADDNATGGVWYWQAPEKFLGEKKKFVGGILSFDLKQSSTDNPFDSPDIIIESEKKKLVFKLPKHPETEWTSYKVFLDEGKGWKITGLNGKDAIESDFDEVFSNIKNIYIRGEYRTGEDTGSLDNIILR